MTVANCRDCGLHYGDFGLDITLPNAQWKAICPEDGLLCGTCIANRCRQIKGAIAIRAVLDIKIK